MKEFVKTRNELKKYFIKLRDDGFFHPDDRIHTGIKKNENSIMFFVKNRTVKHNLLEIEAPTLGECLNLLKKEIKWQ